MSAGRRSEYRPVKSQLVTDADPIAVAEAFRAHFGLSELYLADLDAIAGRARALPTYRALRRRGFRLWVDAGIRDREQADLLAPEAVNLVVGLETAGPAVLADVLQSHASRTVFSLDLRDGVPLGDRAAWEGADGWEIARRTVALGAPHPGPRSGAGRRRRRRTGTESLCAHLISCYDNLEVWAGGGTRNVADLHSLRGAGVRRRPPRLRSARPGRHTVGIGCVHDGASD